MILETASTEKIIPMQERKYETLWRFWFGTIENTPEYFEASMERWFGHNPDFDQEIRQKFLSYFDLLENIELENWKKYPRGRLAVILLADQMSRNIFRGTPQAFRYDRIAQEVALSLCESGLDANYQLAERIFIYLPLEHSENPAHQELSVRKFQELFDESYPSLKKVFEETLNYALVHQDIIRRFGRFPHRNAILNRVSSPEEIEFLKIPGSSF